MVFIEIILSTIGVLPVNGLGESMRISKTLTAMVTIGFALFGGFVGFLFHMAGIQ
jgi:hypothetical protein